MKYLPSTQIFIAASLAVLLAACANDPTVDTREQARTDAGLYPVEGTSMDQVFVDIEADFKNYQQLYVVGLDTSVVEVDYDADVREWRSRDWQLTDKDKQGLKAMFEKAVNSEFEVSGIALTDQPAAGVLVVEPTLKKLEPVAPKDNFSDRNPSNRYYSEGAGKVTLELVFKDGASGKVIATAIDRRDAGTEWRENSAIHNRWEIQRLFNRWVSMMDRSLERVQKL